MKTTEQWLLENAGIFTTHFMLELYKRETEIRADTLRIAEAVARHHAECHENRGKAADDKTRDICNLEAGVCHDVANAIKSIRMAAMPNSYSVEVSRSIRFHGFVFIDR